MGWLLALTLTLPIANGGEGGRRPGEEVLREVQGFKARNFILVNSLPLGEGTSYEGTWQATKRWFSFHAVDDAPSPGGEGWDEGGRDSQLHRSGLNHIALGDKLEMGYTIPTCIT